MLCGGRALLLRRAQALGRGPENWRGLDSRPKPDLFQMFLLLRAFIEAKPQLADDRAPGRAQSRVCQ
jgi:hypothetical protein